MKGTKFSDRDSPAASCTTAVAWHERLRSRLALRMSDREAWEAIRN
jgi:hypothetical protein